MTLGFAWLDPGRTSKHPCVWIPAYFYFKCCTTKSPDAHAVSQLLPHHLTTNRTSARLMTISIMMCYDVFAGRLKTCQWLLTCQGVILLCLKWNASEAYTSFKCCAFHKIWQLTSASWMTTWMLVEALLGYTGIRRWVLLLSRIREGLSKKHRNTWFHLIFEGLIAVPPCKLSGGAFWLLG